MPNANLDAGSPHDSEAARSVAEAISAEATLAASSSNPVQCVHVELGETSAELDDFTCPITHELMEDPVVAR